MFGVVNGFKSVAVPMFFIWVDQAESLEGGPVTY